MSTTPMTPSPIPARPGLVPTAEPAASRYVPDGDVLKGLIWRALVIAAAAIVVALEFPAFVRGPLTLIAAVVTGTFVLRRVGRRGPLDGLLTVVGMAIVSVVLLGIVLNYLPDGLTAVSWGFGIGILELALLAGYTFVRPVASARWVRLPRIHPKGIVWGVATVAVLAGSLVWAVNSFEQTHTAPLALSGIRTGDTAKVTIDAGAKAGDYDLLRITSLGSTVLASHIELDAGTSTTITVKVVADAREEVVLVDSGSAVFLRELILDTRPTTSKVAP